MDKQNYPQGLDAQEILKSRAPLDDNRERFQKETKVRWNAVNINFKGKMPDVEFSLGGTEVKQAVVGSVDLNKAVGNVPLSDWDSKIRERDSNVGDIGEENPTRLGVKNYYKDFVDVSPVAPDREKDLRSQLHSYHSEKGRDIR